MKIFIGLTEIAGYYANLARGFKEIGIDTTFVSTSFHPFSYAENDRASSKFLRFYHYVKMKRLKGLPADSSLMKKLWWKGMYRLSHWLLFLWAIANFDVFIFSFGTTFFLNFQDLPLLKLFKKKLIFVFTGSEVRPAYMNGSLIEEQGSFIGKFTELIKQQKTRIAKIEYYADAIINHSLTAHFQEKSVIQWLYIGIPCEQPIIDEAEVTSVADRIRILHAPSRPLFKGTPMIRQVIKNLKSKGYQIDYIELTGMPHKSVLEEIKRCDFIIDELYSDTPMATFATEAAFFAKPAIVGGYGWNELKQQIPVDKLPPTHICHPEQLEHAVEKLIVDKKYRIELGCKARDFVMLNWCRANVARRFLQIIKGDIPSEWRFDPQNVSYLHGWGLPEVKTQLFIRKIIEYGGKEALQLTDKPALEQLITQFIDTE